MTTLAYIIIVALSVLRLARSNGEIDFVESSINNVNTYEDRVLRPLFDPKTVTLKDPPSIVNQQYNSETSGTHFRVDGWDTNGGGFYIIQLFNQKKNAIILSQSLKELLSI